MYGEKNEKGTDLHGDDPGDRSCVEPACHPAQKSSVVGITQKVSKNRLERTYPKRIPLCEIEPRPTDGGEREVSRRVFLLLEMGAERPLPSSSSFFWTHPNAAKDAISIVTANEDDEIPAPVPPGPPACCRYQGGRGEGSKSAPSVIDPARAREPRGCGEIKTHTMLFVC